MPNPDGSLTSSEKEVLHYSDATSGQIYFRVSDLGDIQKGYARGFYFGDSVAYFTNYWLAYRHALKIKEKRRQNET